MAKEEVVAAASPAPSDHKRKFDDLEPEASEPPTADSNANSNSESYTVKKAEEEKAVTDGDSREMEVSDDKVGFLIGKESITVLSLERESGAKIRIKKVAHADPCPVTWTVKLMGTLENINKAEKLIKNVISEADAGGSPSLVARGFSTVQDAGAAEQLQIQVPNEKVGFIIGKAGETIKNLEIRSGARIQLIPQHLSEGDPSKERTVRVTGDKKQIERASKLITGVMNQVDIK
uniref:K Homology domain-containing protein n=1 Tax=Davidia involucrata TaxID=16924 RepID=A0A5B7BGW5_DAVIN